MSFWGELKRRNVVRVGAAYLVVAWLLLQVVGTVGPMLALPDSFSRGFLLLLAIGFPVVLVISWVFELTPQGLQTQARADRSDYQSSSRRLNTVVVSGLLLALVFVVLDAYFITDISADSVVENDAPNNEQSRAPLAGSASDPNADIKTLAVLPLTNLSGSAESERFADGLTIELIHNLSLLEGLQVPGQTSSFYFKDRDVEPAAIGEMLDVQYLLEGNIRTDGEELRIGIRLSDSRSGFSLWSENYDEELSAFFAVQEDIARSVAEALEVTLGVGKLSGHLGMTRNVEAYNLYLQADRDFEGRGDFQEDAIEYFRARSRLLEQAVAIDPNFSVAWQRLAWAYGMLDAFSNGTIAGARQRQMEAYLTAQELTPSYAGLLSLGPHIPPEFSARTPQEEAERNTAFLAALELQAPPSVFLAQKSRILFQTGYYEEARPLLERLYAIDPFSESPVFALADLRAALGDFEGYFELVSEAYEKFGPPPIQRAGADLWNALMSGNDQWIEAEVEKFRQYEGADANLIDALDNPEEGLAIVRQRLNSMPPDRRNWSNLIPLADFAAFFGDYDLAFDLYVEMLGTGPFENPNRITDFLFRPLYAPVRSHPRFKEVLDESGIDDIWRANGRWGEFCRLLEGSDDFECS